ncbi:DUF305 domain-containing protein [Paenarthrobacter sp. NPDC058040]|uniref:DUF305 domain-containing protein n=1 Tax=unclassified Paenarthrobacter TaxID=2634190 RepID=UPI0036DB39DD
MHTKQFLPVAATAIAAAIALAGCSGTPGPSGTSMPGMDHGNMNNSQPAAADHNAADVMFAQMMIPHHTQAIEMSDVILKKQGVPASVTALATRIKAAQAPEIDTMNGWLKDWNQPTSMSSGHAMDGMMSEDDLTKLETAQGVEAAKLFLSQMITHHEGAITMAKTETASGKNADALQLSKDIVKAQESEIKEMQQLLTTL